MTKNLRWAGGSARRGLPPRRWARPPGLALLGLALVGLVQAGCRSDGCYNCNLGAKIANGVQALGARVFHHRLGCGGGVGGGGCGCGGGEEGVVVESGIPVAPGGMVVPAPGSLVPAPGVESVPSPDLSPIPKNEAAPTGGTGTNSNPASTRGNSGNSRSAYEAYVPRYGTARRKGTDVARALHSSPEAQARARAAYSAAPQAESDDLLDHIPPVDLPGEVTRKATASSPASIPATATATSPAPDVETPARSAAPTPAETLSAAEGAAITLPTITGISTRQAPGIRRTGSVAPSIAGGSAPSVEGLDWLKEKGYRTFVDLRQGIEIDPTFIESVNDRGMVFISLPIVANRLDASRLARFDDLIARTENRPLYFCDTDGTRAGMAWYIHLRVVDDEDPQSAAQKAEEIGLTDAQRSTADAYLAGRKPKAKSVAMATGDSLPPVPEPKPDPRPSTALPSAPTPTAPAVGPPLLPRVPDAPTSEMLPGEPRPQALTPGEPYRDLVSWRPVAALVLTGLGVPLAYWSRSAFSDARSNRRRASLPGAARRSLDAPAG